MRNKTLQNGIEPCKIKSVWSKARYISHKLE